MTTQRILILDVETAPIQACVWRLFKENIGLNQIKQDWHLLSYAAKWLGEDRVLYADQRDAADVEDDYDLICDLWDLLDEADYVIAHNGRKFDIPKIKARMILQGMIPPSPFKVIDTLDIAKREFGFTSNKLEYIAANLSNVKKRTERKFSGFTLWKECLAGNLEAWQEMELYNRDDTLALEEVYLALRAWDTRHPNVSQHRVDADGKTVVCPRCGGTHLHKRGFQRTAVGLTYQRYQCECGGWARGRYAEDSKNARKAIVAAQ